MGTTYSRAISQWSKKEYRNAAVTDAFTNIDNEWINNPDCMARPSCLDTFNVFVGNSMPLISDDYGQTTGTAEVISNRTFSFDGYIGSGGDEDWFKISTSRGGKLTVKAETIKDFANLDIHLSVLDSNGMQITYSDPVAFRGSDGRPGGLNASLTNYTLSSGTYFIRVKGTGALDPLDTGYSSYGSVGKYQLLGTFTDGSKLNQTIAFTQPQNISTSLNITDSPYTLVVTTSSGLDVALTTNDSNVCTISLRELALLKSGMCTVYANQAGNDDFNSASQVVRNITINQAPINDAAPTISGSAAVNQTLTATTGAWTGFPASRYTYQWFACTNDSSIDSCVAISRADRTTFRLTSTQSGSYIRIRVTATNTIAADSEFSLATTAVTS
jgi:hypothetical protein